MKILGRKKYQQYFFFCEDMLITITVIKLITQICVVLAGLTVKIKPFVHGIPFFFVIKGII